MKRFKWFGLALIVFLSLSFLVSAQKADQQHEKHRIKIDKKEAFCFDFDLDELANTLEELTAALENIDFDFDFDEQSFDFDFNFEDFDFDFDLIDFDFDFDFDFDLDFEGFDFEDFDLEIDCGEESEQSKKLEWRKKLKNKLSKKVKEKI